VIFGAELSGESIRKLVSLGNTLPGMTRYIALADYANSRGAADMGLLPGRLPGYVPTSDAAGRKQWESLWGTPVPTAPGLTAPEMLHSEKLRALYVVGSNPFKTYGLEPSRESLPALEFLVVHELFMTETAQLADVVLPAASLYEKEGTVTNTCGEVQRLRPALDPGEVRTDFDILRLLTHAMNKPMHYRSPEAVAEEIHRHVPGYGLSMATLLAGQAVPTAPLDGQAPVETATGLVFSSDDSLFTSGTLGRYSQALNLVKEKDLPRSKL
jgi:NADH-quinone oxidoreductase subunit G